MKGVRCFARWSYLSLGGLLFAGIALGLLAAARAWTQETAAGTPAAEEPPVRIEGEMPVRPELQVFSGIRGWLVNGEEISVEELRDRAVAYYGPHVLQGLVAGLLLRQEAKRQGITATEQEVDAKAKQIREEKGITSDAAFARYLLTEEKSAAWFQDKVRDYLLLEKLLSDKVYVSDSEVTRFYNRFSDAYRRPETIWFRAMSFRTAEGAQAAVQELRKGRSFEELAQEAATSPQERSVAGKLRKYERGQSLALPAEIEGALFQAPLNQVVGPLQTEQSVAPGKTDTYYHLFRVEKKADPHQFTLDEVRDVIRGELRRQKLETQVYPGWLRTALAGASIEPLRSE